MVWLLLSSTFNRVNAVPQTAPPVNSQGVQKNLGRNTSGTAEPDWPNISDQVGAMLINKVWVKKEGGRGVFRIMVFVLPSNSYRWWSPAFLEMAEHLPVDGKCEWIPCFALLLSKIFASDCLHLNPGVFSLSLTLWDYTLDASWSGLRQHKLPYKVTITNLLTHCSPIRPIWSWESCSAYPKIYIGKLNNPLLSVAQM